MYLKNLLLTVLTLGVLNVNAQEKLEKALKDFNYLDFELAYDPARIALMPNIYAMTTSDYFTKIRTNVFCEYNTKSHALYYSGAANFQVVKPISLGFKVSNYLFAETHQENTLGIGATFFGQELQKSINPIFVNFSVGAYYVMGSSKGNLALNYEIMTNPKPISGDLSLIIQSFGQLGINEYHLLQLCLESEKVKKKIKIPAFLLVGTALIHENFMHHVDRHLGGMAVDFYVGIGFGLKDNPQRWGAIR